MKLDIEQIQKQYEESKGWRELKKYAFVIGTLGLGALYLWATTSIINKGEIGLRRNSRGEMILLPPGRHSNFPWETYPVEPQSLSKKEIYLGPYKIISVETGYIAKTLNKGALEILNEGQHILTDASHVFDRFFSVKQETKQLEAVTAYTKDNVGLTLHADVRYKIKAPEIAISQIDDIDNSIKQIAEINISQIVSHHNLADFAPVTSIGEGQGQGNGICQVITELTEEITKKLSQLGINLLNIGITSWRINDQVLAHELAQGAVIKSQVQSKKHIAELDANVKEISTNSEVNRILALADGEAKAIKIKGEAFIQLAKDFGNNHVAQSLFSQSQQIGMVQSANNPSLNFHQPLVGVNQHLFSL